MNRQTSAKVAALQGQQVGSPTCCRYHRNSLVGSPSRPRSRR